VNNISRVPEALLNKLNIAKELLLKEKGNIRIISHYDADGICAAGILCHALLRKKLKFHATLTRSLKDEFVDQIKEEDYHTYVFCDMGSGHLEGLSKLAESVIILDHHSALKDSDNPILINPNFHGMSGTNEICASSLTFLLAIVIDEDNWDLSALALAGCIGDKQHTDGLFGFNAYMVETAKNKGLIEVSDSLKLSGTKLKTALLEGLDPYIRDMSAREDKVLEFLRKLNIDSDLEVGELNSSQKRALASAIILKLLGQDVRPEIAEGIVTKRFWLPKWNLYANDLSNYINSCGRMGNTGTGLALCLGDEKALKEGKKLRKAYKDKLRQGLLKLEKEGATDLKNIQFFYTENSSLAGANAGLGMLYLFDQEKPTFALTVLDKETKISSRGTAYLVSKGLDLATACREAAMSVGGRGGGHPIASGATIPKGKEEAFLDTLNEIVGRQLMSKDES
jgi:RecJ-like exonuclease